MSLKEIVLEERRSNDKALCSPTSRCLTEGRRLSKKKDDNKIGERPKGDGNPSEETVSRVKERISYVNCK